jgi:hypothetical protein
MPIPAEELPLRRPIPALQVPFLQTEQVCRPGNGKRQFSTQPGLLLHPNVPRGVTASKHNHRKVKCRAPEFIFYSRNKPYLIAFNDLLEPQALRTAGFRAAAIGHPFARNPALDERREGFASWLRCAKATRSSSSGISDASAGRETMTSGGARVPEKSVPVRVRQRGRVRRRAKGQCTEGHAVRLWTAWRRASRHEPAGLNSSDS